MKWYKANLTNWCDERIEIVEPEKETEKFLIINGRRQGKYNRDWHQFFKTFEEAKSSLLAIFSRRLDRAKEEVIRIQGKLDEIKELKDVR